MSLILKIISAYELLLIILGTIGNILILIVCLNLRNSTFILMRFLAVADLISLYFWNLNHFTTAFFGLDLQNFNFYYCKIFEFIQFSSLQISAWILVSLKELVLNIFKQQYLIDINKYFLGAHIIR